MRRIIFLLVATLFVCLQAVAQTAISGTVTDSKGDPVPGASVRAKGYADVGTVTDFNGKYSLSVPTEATTLVFSFVGLKVKEVAIGGQSVVNASLENEDVDIDEVIVVAYGTTQKKSFTGSVSVVKNDDLEKSSSPTFQNALQGKVAGLQVNTASGQPGGSTAIAVRGVGSFGDHQPLYVIDGVPVASGNYSDVASDDYGTSGSILSTLNPADIQSVSVLKDASAASLYGSRAANGVVIITTKSGAKGNTKFSVSAKYGITDVATKMPDVLDAGQYFKLYWDDYYQRGVDAGLTGQALADFANSSTIGGFGINPYNTANPYNENGQLNSGAELYWDQDWRKDIIKKGAIQEYNVSAQGGNASTSYYVSGNYSSTEGNVVGSDFERYSARFNFDTKLKDFLRIGMNNMVSFTDVNTPPGGGGGAAPMSFVNNVPNIYPLYAHDADGNIVMDQKGNKVYNYYNATNFDFNPVGLADVDIYNAETYRVLSSAFVELTFLKDFKLSTKPSVDYMGLRETRYYNPNNGNGAVVDGRSAKYSKRDIRFNITNQLDWGHTYGDHTVQITAAQEAFKSTYDYLYAGATNFPFTGNDHLIAAGTPDQPESYMTERTLASYLLRANYDLSNKYYLSASLRRDGSSVFGTDYKWGTFYSFGASWRIIEEDFIANLSWLSNLKLRLSYGTSGNDNIGRYDALGLFELGYGYGGNPGLRYTQLANPKLRWEKAVLTNVGLEFGIFDNRITGEVDYFIKESDDLLYDKPLSATTGFDDIKANVARIANSGIEILLHSENIKTNDFIWTSDFNISFIKNEIKEMTQEEQIEGSKRWKVGGDIMQYHIRKWAGVDPSDGKPMWYRDIPDENGDPTGVITVTKEYNQATRFDVGSALPKFTGGFQNTVAYKGIDFTFNIYFSYGGKVLDYTQMDMYHGGGVPGQQQSVDVLNAWKQPGDVTDVPRFYAGNSDNGNERSTRFMHDGSYIRFKNISLGYNFPGSMLEKAKISSLRAFVSLENYLTFAAYKGTDPELPLTGNTNNYYPHIKTVMFGLNLNF